MSSCTEIWVTPTNTFNNTTYTPILMGIPVSTAMACPVAEFTKPLPLEPCHVMPLVQVTCITAAVMHAPLST